MQLASRGLHHNLHRQRPLVGNTGRKLQITRNVGHFGNKALGVKLCQDFCLVRVYLELADVFLFNFGHNFIVPIFF